MKHRCNSARLVVALFVGLVSTLFVAGCRAPLYYYPEYNFAGRATPPSGLQQRVLASFTANGGSGGAVILDGLRDLRRNVQNTIPGFSISGYSGGYPSTILNFPEQQAGYILDANNGALAPINYAKESSNGTLATYGANAPSVAAAPDGTRFVGTTATSGQLIVTSGGGSYVLNLPNVDRIVMNPGNTIILAMTRNSGTTPNALFRVVQLTQPTSPGSPTLPSSYVDCEPLINPVYCVVPVTGSYDRPVGAYFSLDGTSVYVLNSGPENGGRQASVSVLQTAALLVNNLVVAPSPLATLPVANPIPIPGGVTAALSDGTTLFLAGQSLYSPTANGALGSAPRADGLFTGYLTQLNQTTYVPSHPVSIADGTHTRMLFADNSTLWVGGSHCASGERAATNQNYNCLTMVKLGSATPTATVIPSLIPGGTTIVGYPNTNGNLYYYGDLTGECWVQNYNKIYTAYGGQIHIFSTVDGSEIDNTNVTVQGTVLDVAYMDALTNAAD